VNKSKINDGLKTLSQLTKFWWTFGWRIKERCRCKEGFWKMG